MRKLDEQWIENGRMYKCVGLGDDMSEIIKDLGPVNGDGCLAEERTGKFPVVENRFHNLWAVTVNIDDFVKTVQVTCYGKTKQEAIDTWNRRAM